MSVTPAREREEVMTAGAEEVIAAEEEIRQTCRKRKIAAVVGSIYKINDRTYDTAVVFDSGANCGSAMAR